MNRFAVLAVAVLLATPAVAQDDENAIILPRDAQECVLPASPDAIPDDVTLDQLREAKADIGAFQEKVGDYRACLDAANANPENTPGNKQAIIDAYNYSVEMEERVAARFNDAVRAYKERKAAAEG